MSIHFRCAQCGQKLRVGDDKAGQRAKCPRCKVAFTVPAVSTPVDEPPPAPGSTADPAMDDGKGPPDKLPEIVVYEDNVEWVYESEPKPETETVVDYDKVAVPRRVLYMQGILLGGVALVSFVLGLLMRGGPPSDEGAEGAPRPGALTGQVTYSALGTMRPDEGSVLVILPVEFRPQPDQRAPIEGLRPGDPIPDETNATLQLIRSWGGDYARTDARGEFRTRVPRSGRYYLLVISGHVERSPQAELERTHVAQVGRYFENPVDLLTGRQYRWTQLAIRGNHVQDVKF